MVYNADSALTTVITCGLISLEVFATSLKQTTSTRLNALSRIHLFTVSISFYTALRFVCLVWCIERFGCLCILYMVATHLISFVTSVYFCVSRYHTFAQYREMHSLSKTSFTYVRHIFYSLSIVLISDITISIKFIVRHVVSSYSTKLSFNISDNTW